MIKGLVILGLVFFSSVLYAEGWSGYKNVKQLNVGGNGQHGTFSILKDYSFTGCSSAVAFVGSATNPNYKELFSTFLEAQASGKKVSVLTSGCGGNGNNYPSIVEVLIGES